MSSLFLLEDAQGGIASFLPLIAIVAVMYFFFIRPQMKKQKDENKFRAALEKGMKVVTTSGIHGKILELDEKTILLECENCRLRFERAAISKDMTSGANPSAAKK
ncbi:MAG: preprotein translocase subunit YajC [Schleiferiaceae bacterium]|nr:preprotein translocase subunit YajC [Schleiferiaceae bacterium]